MASRRRAARKLALNVLYEHEMSGTPVERILERMSGNPAFDFASALARGVQAHREEIDDILSREAPDWNLDRMPPIDRSLLRLAIFEILYLDDIPAAVSINEAVDLARIYSTEESGAFVNGVLGSVLARPRP